MRVPEARALAIMRGAAERRVTLSDRQVTNAIRACRTDWHIPAEGEGAAGLAALLQEMGRMAGRKSSVVPRGGNIGLALVRRRMPGA
jgi:threonine dehydratase